MSSAELVRSFFETLSSGDLEGVRRLLRRRVDLVHRRHRHPGSGSAQRAPSGIVDGFLAPVRGLFEPGEPKVEIRQPDRRRRSRRGRGDRSRPLPRRPRLRQPLLVLDRGRRRQDQVDQGVHGLELRGRAGLVTGPAIAPPEPDLTPAEVVARAHALRPLLVEQQAATEARTYYSREMHEEFLRAGFYRMLVPRRFGGYEFDLPTFMRVIIEIARVPVDRLVPLPLGGTRAPDRGAVRGAGAGRDVR